MAILQVRALYNHSVHILINNMIVTKNATLATRATSQAISDASLDHATI